MSPPVHSNFGTYATIRGVSSSVIPGPGKAWLAHGLGMPSWPGRGLAMAWALGWPSHGLPLALPWPRHGLGVALPWPALGLAMA